MRCQGSARVGTSTLRVFVWFLLLMGLVGWLTACGDDGPSSTSGASPANGVAAPDAPASDAAPLSAVSVTRTEVGEPPKEPGTTRGVPSKSKITKGGYVYEGWESFAAATTKHVPGQEFLVQENPKIGCGIRASYQCYGDSRGDYGTYQVLEGAQTVVSASADQWVPGISSMALFSVQATAVNELRRSNRGMVPPPPYEVRLTSKRVTLGGYEINLSSSLVTRMDSGPSWFRRVGVEGVKGGTDPGALYYDLRYDATCTYWIHGSVAPISTNGYAVARSSNSELWQRKTRIAGDFAVQSYVTLEAEPHFFSRERHLTSAGFQDVWVKWDPDEFPVFDARKDAHVVALPSWWTPEQMNLTAAYSNNGTLNWLQAAGLLDSGYGTNPAEGTYHTFYFEHDRGEFELSGARVRFLGEKSASNGVSSTWVLKDAGGTVNAGNADGRGMLNTFDLDTYIQGATVAQPDIRIVAYDYVTLADKIEGAGLTWLANLAKAGIKQALATLVSEIPGASLLTDAIVDELWDELMGTIVDEDIKFLEVIHLQKQGQQHDF